MGKSPSYDVELSEDLESQFDEESVRSAMNKLESNRDGKIDFVLFRAVLGGRGASLRWPNLEQLLFTNPDLNKVALLSDYAPRTKVDQLLTQLNIDDHAVVKEIRNGGFPVLRVLPKTHRDRIWELLRNSVSSDPADEGTAFALQYLLDFDKDFMRDRRASQESIELAIHWCCSFPERSDIVPVLCRLLYQSDNSNLPKIARRRYDLCKSKDDAWWLLSALLDQCKTGPFDLIQKWLRWDEPSHHDAYILAQWLRTSNCCRSALRFCRRELNESIDRMLIRELAPFAGRKPVRHWFYRFLTRNIGNDSVIGSIHTVVRRAPTTQSYALARIAAEKANTSDRSRIIIELAKSRAQDVMPMIVQMARDFPNACNSFDLMCAGAAANPQISVPWIHEWIETAMPFQKTQGLIAILSAERDSRYWEEACQWYWKIAEEGLPAGKTQFALLTQLIIANPRNDLLNEARQILGGSHDKAHASIKKLAGCVRRAGTAIEGTSERSARD